MGRRLAWLGVCLLSSALAAQSALQPGNVAVVTSNGLWLLRPPSTNQILLAPASTFGGLTAPAIEWRPGTDELLVCDGNRLFRVTLLPGTTVSLADITPAGVTSANFKDLEVHPVDGRLLLLDAAQSQLLRYAPPFAAGMAPDLVVPLAPGAVALAVDGRSWPPQVVVAYEHSVQSQGLQGDVKELAAIDLDALDKDRQAAGLTVGVRTGLDSVLALISNSVAVEVNLLASLCAPVVLRPVDAEYDTATESIVVLAQKGMGPCMPGYSGKNHVVALPLGQSALVPPKVLTGSVSNITGLAGDLTLVWSDQAFAGSYGSDAGSTPLQLLAPVDPAPGDASFALDVRSAPPTAPVLLLVGSQPLDAVLKSGQAVLVTAMLTAFAGVTDAAGKLHVAAPLDASLPLGLDVWVQAAAFAGGPQLSNGVYLRIAGP
jgi:hypothetical protein